jgi:hypothetical protein
VLEGLIMTDEFGRMLKLLRRTEACHENAGDIIYLWKNNGDQNLPEYDK